MKDSADQAERMLVTVPILGVYPILGRGGYFKYNLLRKISRIEYNPIYRGVGGPTLFWRGITNFFQIGYVPQNC